MKVITYVRVSDHSKIEEYSMDNQQRLLIKFCNDKGWNPVKVFREQDEPKEN